MAVITDKVLREAAASLGQCLRERGLFVSPAESCTGGWVAKALTDTTGSSDYLEVGLVTYSNAAKQQLLQVSPQSLAEFGAVSEVVVREMVNGTLAATGADVALAVSGIAGPGGGTEAKPVGTVWFAWGDREGRIKTDCQVFGGDRNEIRSQATLFILEAVTEFVQKEH